MDFLQEELDEILNIFAQEGAEILQSMDKNLLLLEKKPSNMDIAMHLFRDAHSLKGSARMLGFDGIQNIAHKIEDVLGFIREGKLKVNSNVTDTISASLVLIDNLIKKTVEQKSEYVSEESDFYIKKLNDLCSFQSTSFENTQEYEGNIDNTLFEKSFSKLEDLITGLVLIYTKTAHDREIEHLSDVMNILTELSYHLEANKEKELHALILAVSEKITDCMNEKNISEDAIADTGLKINEFIQKFISVANSKGLKTKDYFKEVKRISSSYYSENGKENAEKLKNSEFSELVAALIEIIEKEDKNKSSYAQAKSITNEIISRLEDTGLKRIYSTILLIIKDYEKSSSKPQKDSIEAIRETLEGTRSIIESMSVNSLENYSEEIELLYQKILIISQIIRHEIENPPKLSKTRSQNAPVDWAQSFDSASIKTLRINSDKLDKLVNQIGDLIVARIKAKEQVTTVKAIQDALIDWQKYYHKIGYYMKFYEKKYMNEMTNDKGENIPKNDSFYSYNRQLIAFHNQNAEKITNITSSLNFLMKELQENNIKQDAVTSEIEAMVKSMRILPLSTVLNLFPRMVHNIARDKEKEIDLVIEGGETSADKKIIEDIKIPIMHIVRNSIDHGIETPAERENLGKDPVGTIVINASQKENKIIISIKDDGRGINIEKIKAKAIEKGFITKETADTMSKEQLANFIFYPGFSTGDVVTELSGRGLGLDIVHTKISQLNGRIDVYSEENKGTVVTMELPTTMATLKTFIIKENSQLYAIPASNIQNVIRISPDELNKRDDKYYFIYDSEAVPICSLSSILGSKSDNDIEPSDKLTVMVIKSENLMTGIIVQKLVGDEEILHKKLPEPLIKVKNISGITTLANGEMCLLLNLGDILTSNQINTPDFAMTKSLTLKDNSKYKILIVDDSITTRRLLGNILTSNGYRTDTDSNAKDALRRLETQKYDLIITDYKMPFMSGLEFAAILRSKEKTKDIPIIAVTSIEKGDIKEEFLKLNVKDFIKKGYFEQQSFLKIVSRNLNFTKDEG